MGIYRGVLIAQGGMPLTLPKFCMLMTYCERRETAVNRKGNMVFRVHLPGDATDEPTATIEIPFEQARNNELSQGSPVPSDDPDIEHLVRIDIPLVLSPFIVQKPGMLKIRATIGDEIIKIGALRIEHQPLAEAPNPT